MYVYTASMSSPITEDRGDYEAVHRKYCRAVTERFEGEES